MEKLTASVWRENLRFVNPCTQAWSWVNVIWGTRCGLNYPRHTAEVQGQTGGKARRIKNAKVVIGVSSGPKRSNSLTTILLMEKLDASV